MKAQLPLNLRLRDSASFENFFPAGNSEVVDILRRTVESIGTGQSTEKLIFVAGASGSGRTHLLQAVCRQAEERGLSYIYVPLKEATQLSPSLLDNAGSASLVCCDDVNVVAGQSEWERALFRLIEALRASGGLFLVSATMAPAQLGIQLPDLVTRLGWGPFYPLEPLSDDNKLAALQNRAQRLGLELPTDVARYVLARYPRDMHSLFNWLDRIDRHSLASQRRLTIPFVRELETGSISG